MGLEMREILLPSLRDSVQEALSDKTCALLTLSQAVERLSKEFKSTEDRLNKLVDQSETLRVALEEHTGFHAKMHVHEAWAKHPGVREIFAAHHLPHCDSCAVGADERLEEVAFGYALNLDELLSALNALC